MFFCNKHDGTVADLFYVSGENTTFDFGAFPD